MVIFYRVRSNRKQIISATVENANSIFTRDVRPNNQVGIISNGNKCQCCSRQIIGFLRVRTRPNPTHHYGEFCDPTDPWVGPTRVQLRDRVVGEGLSVMLLARRTQNLKLRHWSANDGYGTKIVPWSSRGEYTTRYYKDLRHSDIDERCRGDVFQYRYWMWLPSIECSTRANRRTRAFFRICVSASDVTRFQRRRRRP